MELHEEVGAVRRETVLDAGREAVWAMLAEPEGLAAWLADEVDLPAVEPGAEGVVREDGEERLVTVEDVEPGRRVALTWCAPGGAPSVVELTLDDDGEDATRLVVVEIPLARLQIAAGRALQAAARSHGRGPLALAR
jgi:uncharacterized protein YndB with AHSA1/START domain